MNVKILIITLIKWCVLVCKDIECFYHKIKITQTKIFVVCVQVTFSSFYICIFSKYSIMKIYISFLHEKKHFQVSFLFFCAPFSPSFCIF